MAKERLHINIIVTITRALWSTYPVHSLAIACCQTVAYFLSMNMFVFTVTCSFFTCTEDTRSLIFNFAGKEGLVSYCVYFIHCLFVTLLISNCHHSRILIDSQRARALARAFTMHSAYHDNMQIIAVGVANRRDQQKARFMAFVVPFRQL